MSRLQHYVRSIISVIIEYCSTQTNKKYDIDKIIQSENIRDTLNEIISEALGKYPKRTPLFHYYLYVIVEAKTLLDKVIPLTVDESEILNNLLVSLLSNTALLIKTSQNSSLSIKYGENVAKVSGLLTPSISGFGQGTLCRSGGIIQQGLFERYNLETSIQSEEIKRFVTRMIKEDQLPLELEFLKNKVVSLEAQLDSEKELTSVLHSDNDTKLQEIISLKEQLTQEKVSAEELQKEKTGLLKKVASLTTANKDQGLELIHLRTQNIALRQQTESGSSQNKLSTNEMINKFFPTRSTYGLFPFSSISLASKAQTLNTDSLPKDGHLPRSPSPLDCSKNGTD